MKGALLAFGGERGANVALMVEVLAAGLTGANWSLDAPAFNAGAENPGVGMFVLALSPALLAPQITRRLAAQLGRLSDGYGVHIPGRAKARARERAEVAGLDIPREVYDVPRMEPVSSSHLPHIATRQMAQRAGVSGSLTFSAGPE